MNLLWGISNNDGFRARPIFLYVLFLFLSYFIVYEYLFIFSSGNTESYYGPAINPHRGPNGEAVVAGGSSGGSAVAVAAGMCYGYDGRIG